MKRKNVVVGEKYILKGNKEDWYFINDIGCLKTPKQKDSFKKGDEVVVVKDFGDSDFNVRDAETKINMMCIDCKFLKKIKGDK